jgi:hypothetical protein
MHLDDEVRLGSSMGTLSIEIEREVLRILV